jgi:nitrate/nitrite transporter NarK
MGEGYRVLSVAEGFRVFGFLLLEPFFALYLYRDLGVSFPDVGILLLVVTSPSIIVGLFGGVLADRWGRRRLIVLTSAVEVAGFAGLAISMRFHSLAGSVGFFVAVALAVGAGLPATSAYVADSSLGSDRTRAYSGLRIADNAGASAGVAVGGFLIGSAGFFGATLMAAVLLGITTGVLWGWLPATPYDLALTQETRSWFPPDLGPSPPKSAPGGYFRSLRAVLSDRIFLAMCAGFLCVGFFQAFYLTAIPLYTNLVLGVPYWTLGLGFALNSVLVVATQTPTTARVIGRSLTGVGIVGAMFYVVAFLILGAAGQWHILPVVLFFAAMVVLTLGENLVEIPKRTLPSNMASSDQIGAYNGVFRTIFGLGQTLSPLGVGFALASISTPLFIWLFLLIPAIPAMGLFAYVRVRADRRADRA